MEAVRLNEYITEKGLYIDRDKLKNFDNTMVEVIILPVNDKNVEISGFKKFSGTITDNEANEILGNTNDCRLIDESTW